MTRTDPVLAPLAAVLLVLGCGPREEPRDAAPAGERSQRPGSPGGEVVVALPPADQAAMRLEFARLAPLAMAREEAAYGRIVSDPSRSTTVRAPLAGTLLPGDGDWPEPGARVAAQAVVARLAPRWTPQDRLELAPRAATVRAELAALEAERPAQEAELERARALNAAEKSVSDRELAETGARLAVLQARLDGARELLRLLEAASSSTASPAPIAILAGHAGEAVELLARPGEFVESGAPLLRLEDFGAPLCTIDLFPGSRVSPAVTRGRVRPAGTELVLEAERVGVANGAGAGGLSRALLFRLHPGTEDLAVRPGLALLAWLPLEGETRAGALVPGSAVVRAAGRGWVYVRRGEGEVVRRQVELTSPVDGGWFVESDWASSAEVLVRGAQNVLSLELLGRQGAEEEEEED
jgi:hypothetical protein